MTNARLNIRLGQTLRETTFLLGNFEKYSFSISKYFSCDFEVFQNKIITRNIVVRNSISHRDQFQKSCDPFWVETARRTRGPLFAFDTDDLQLVSVVTSSVRVVSLRRISRSHKIGFRKTRLLQEYAAGSTFVFTRSEPNGLSRNVFVYPEPETFL